MNALLTPQYLLGYFQFVLFCFKCHVTVRANLRKTINFKREEDRDEIHQFCCQFLKACLPKCVQKTPKIAAVSSSADVARLSADENVCWCARIAGRCMGVGA